MLLPPLVLPPWYIRKTFYDHEFCPHGKCTLSTRMIVSSYYEYFLKHFLIFLFIQIHKCNECKKIVVVQNKLNLLLLAKK